ncbi:MAG: YggT family protein [candidate division NC10 bacterium]|nr:YggT family protein [candidate division NC10 bacterium]HZX60152.1 YggT family protein [Candidatus Methylomirabilis sp.]
MFLLANLVSALAQIVGLALQIYMWIIIIRAIISWVNPDLSNPIVQFLYRSTEPVLRPIRRILPITWGIDFSPLVVILAIIFLDQFLVASLRDLAWRLR